jgi:serine/threonine-protein kinase
MAPEQGAAATVDHRADVYAFGVLAYELLTGTLPFQGATAVATLLEHQTKVPEPPSRRRPGLSPDMERLILKALAKRPEDRPQSMAEVASVLTVVLVAIGLPPVYERAPEPPPMVGPYAGFTERFEVPGVPRQATGRGETVALEPPAEPEVAVTAIPQERPVPARRRAGVLAALAVAVALAVVAGAVLAWNRGTAATSNSGPAELPRTPSPAERERVGERASAPSPIPPPTPPDLTPHGDAPAAVPPAPPARRGLGEATGRGENPYRKLDDLKPDPF